MPHPDSSSWCLYPLLRLCGYYPPAGAGSFRTSSRFLPRERNKARGVWGREGAGQAGFVAPVQPSPSLLLRCGYVPWAPRVSNNRQGGANVRAPPRQVRRGRNASKAPPPRVIQTLHSPTSTSWSPPSRLPPGMKSVAVGSGPADPTRVRGALGRLPRAPPIALSPAEFASIVLSAAGSGTRV